jgi:hypothetical protein
MRWSRGGNIALSQLVDEASSRLKTGSFRSGRQFLRFVRRELECICETYDCGCLDTVVKENVFIALQRAASNAGLSDFDQMEIYGW